LKPPKEKRTSQNLRREERMRRRSRKRREKPDEKGAPRGAKRRLEKGVVLHEDGERHE